MIFPVPCNSNHSMIINNWAIKFHPSATYKSEKKLQLCHSQTYLTLEFCFSMMFISCFSTCALHSRHRDRTTHLHTGQGTCSPSPAAVQENRTRYVLRVGCAAQHSWLTQTGSQVRSVGGNTSFQWVFVVEDWTTRQLTLGFAVVGQLSGWGFFTSLKNLKDLQSRAGQRVCWENRKIMGITRC